MKKISLVTSFLIFFFSFACGSFVKSPTPVDYPGIQLPVSHVEEEYRVHVGDQLDIKLFYNPELNETVIVRPDGRISLQLVHELMAVGLTPGELMRLLRKSYEAELTKPEVTVIVRSFGGRSVFVDGEVNRPGIFTPLRPITVLQSIAQAGGVKDTARTSEVVVIRRGADNRPLVIPVNINKAVDGRDLKQDFILQPFDIVYVPKTFIANLNVWVDQYLRKNIPLNAGVGFSYSYTHELNPAIP
jgi:polysaccharide export outer membrane protein